MYGTFSSFQVCSNQNQALAANRVYPIRRWQPIYAQIVPVDCRHQHADRTIHRGHMNCSRPRAQGHFIIEFLKYSCTQSGTPEGKTGETMLEVHSSF